MQFSKQNRVQWLVAPTVAWHRNCSDISGDTLVGKVARERQLGGVGASWGEMEESSCSG